MKVWPAACGEADWDGGFHLKGILFQGTGTETPRIMLIQSGVSESGSGLPSQVCWMGHLSSFTKSTWVLIKAYVQMRNTGYRVVATSNLVLL